MYKIVTKFMNGKQTENSAAMYSIAMMYASNVANSDGVRSVTVYNSSGYQCVTFRTYVEKEVEVGDDDE